MKNINQHFKTIFDKEKSGNQRQSSMSNEKVVYLFIIFNFQFQIWIVSNNDEWFAEKLIVCD